MPCIARVVEASMRKTITAFAFALLSLTGTARADPKPSTPGELRMEMRRVWDDQAVYTRNFIVSTLAMREDQGPVTQYLIDHQDVLAAAIQPFYGKEASKRLGVLLREHVILTADLVRTISEGDVERVPRLRAYWFDNVQQIAAYLATLNPRWNKRQLEDSLEMYLDLTMAEIEGRSIRNWDWDVAAYERVGNHTVHLADFLANGIVKQFPERFR
jgi:hypothetical protein